MKRSFTLSFFPIVLYTLLPLCACEDYTLNITMGNLTIKGGNETVYLCKMFKVDELLPEGAKDKKLHAYKIEAILDSPKVHHTLLFGCNEDVEYIAEVFPCADRMPSCAAIVGGYLMGRKTIELPEDSGLEFGEGVTKMVIMQIHYNNHDLKEFKDNSGLKYYLTDELKKYDAGVMSMTRNYSQLMLTPGERNATLVETCPSECTNRIEPPGIHIFGAGLHGHTALKRIRLEIEQEGEIDDTTFRDDRFEFHWQYLHFLEKPFVFKPGSNINLICEYDTSSRTEVTYGGPSSLDEMCNAYVLYYPRENGPALCSSSRGCIFIQ